MKEETLERVYKQLQNEAHAAGYFLNPDKEFVLGLVDGLLTNQSRYGYWACPCRLAEGDREKDLDLICPCDYRDPDLEDYGTCYCALYVSEEVSQGKRKLEPIPERREVTSGAVSSVSPVESNSELHSFSKISLPIWRCKVCGYLCARPQPPLKCPVCKVDKDRFERFL